MFKIDWSTIPEAIGLRPGNSRKCICTEKVSATLVKTAPDADIMFNTHWHENEQFIIVIAGSLTANIDGQEIECNAGDLICFPPRVVHGVIAVGDKGATYYEIFAPGRKDHLPGWVGPSALNFD